MLALFTNKRVYFILSGGISVCLLLMHPMLVAHSSTVVGENRTRVDAPIIYNRESAGLAPLVIQSQRNGQLWAGSTQLEIPSQRSGQSSTESLRLVIQSQKSQSAVESTPLEIPSQKSDQPSLESTPLEIPSQVSNQPSLEPTQQATSPQKNNQLVIEPTQLEKTAPPPQRSSQPVIKSTQLAKALPPSWRSSQSPVKRTQLAKTLPPSQRSSQLPVKRAQRVKTQHPFQKSSQLPKRPVQSVISPKEKGSLPIEAPKQATSVRGNGRIPGKPVISSHGSLRQNNRSLHDVTPNAKPTLLVGRKGSSSGNQISSQPRRRIIRYRANNRVKRIDPPMRNSRVNRTLINRRAITVHDYCHIIDI